MRILVLQENEDHAVLPSGESIAEVVSVVGTAEMVAHLKRANADAIILAPSTPDQTLRDAVAACPSFTVEVQKENVTSAHKPTANADAQLFGFGNAGVAMAIELIKARAS